MQDLIRISVADSAQHARIGERALERVVLRGQHGAKRIEIGGKDVDPSRVERRQVLFSSNDMERGSFLRSSFGENQRTVGKIERREILSAAKLRLTITPMQAAGNHQVQNEPKIAFHPNRDTLADAPQLLHLASFRARERRLNRPQQKRTGHANLLQRLAGDARLERVNISRYIGQFGHRRKTIPYQLARPRADFAIERTPRDESFATPPLTRTARWE